MKKRQAGWFSEWEMKDSAETRHGGGTRTGRRKVRRPLDSRRPLHLVLRSSKARGEFSFLRPHHRAAVDGIIARSTKRFGVRVERFANVGNHLHLMLRFRHRVCFQNFLRVVTCLIARAVTGAVRGQSFGSFWDALAFTRVVQSSQAERILRSYIEANVVEAEWGRDARAEFLQRSARSRATPGSVACG